ncbi:phosphotransferase family protein [Streptomyces scabiei]|uniref:phosphotransferase family protein n=1 Tax=Streptomyces scabiei TaxID=1930 RepID=UPI0036EA3E1A
MTATADADVLPALRAKVRRAAHPHPTSCAHPDTVLAQRPDGTVVRHANTVAKAHAPDTEPTRLALLLTVAGSHPDILLAPLDPTPTPLHGRLVTFWPYGSPVDPDTPEAAPWEEAATLLARLHRQPPPPGLPPMRGPAKAARAIARLEATAPRHPATPSILRAWRTLPAWARNEAPMPDTATLCHGDLHLGQLVRHPATTGPWRLIDVDDLGVGVPAWDLARPAAWFACGLLHPDDWARFLAAYQRAGGPAVPPHGDPWTSLDVPARALTAQTAALAIAKSTAAGHPLDDAQQSVVDACDRMGSIPPESVDPFPK